MGGAGLRGILVKRQMGRAGHYLLTANFVIPLHLFPGRSIILVIPTTLSRLCGNLIKKQTDAFLRPV
jgi:hypothetical protein